MYGLAASVMKARCTLAARPRRAGEDVLRMAVELPVAGKSGSSCCASAGSRPNQHQCMAAVNAAALRPTTATPCSRGLGAIESTDDSELS